MELNFLLIFIIVSLIFLSSKSIKNINKFFLKLKNIKNIIIIFLSIISFLKFKDKKKIFIPNKRVKLSNNIKKLIASNQNWKCKICNNLLDHTYEIDHIKPIFLDGLNNIENLQALCRNCHGKKTFIDTL